LYLVWVFAAFAGAREAQAGSGNSSRQIGRCHVNGSLQAQLTSFLACTPCTTCFVLQLRVATFGKLLQC